MSDYEMATISSRATSSATSATDVVLKVRDLGRAAVSSGAAGRTGHFDRPGR
jgi:hypothetical protein